MGPTGAIDSDPRLRVIPGPVAPRVRLVCFPHAGGSTSFYRPWRALIPDHVELVVARYPGGTERITEQPAQDVEELADAAVAALGDRPGLPFVLFGHSLGALVAYEAALRTQSTGRPPAHVFVSGSAAPHTVRAGTVWTRDDDAFWAAVRALGGMDDAILHNEDLREIILPGLRSDFRVAETYGPREVIPVDCPVTALTGNADPSVRLDAVRSWGDVAKTDFATRVFPGGHFFLAEEMDSVVRLVTSHLPRSQDIR